MSPAYQYVGTRPETIVGMEPKNISEEEYDALPWELQQAVLLNLGSDGGPLYVERPSAADKRVVTKMMTADEPDEADQVAAPEPDLVPSIIVDTPAEPDLNQPLDQPAEGAN